MPPSTGPSAPLMGKKSERAAKAARAPRAGLLASLRNSFLAGVVIAAPIFITFGVLYWLVTGPLADLDRWVQGRLPQAFIPDFATGVAIVPGFGVLVAVTFLTVLGIVARNFVGRFFIRLGEQILDSVPLVRNLYGFFKNVFETALRQSDKSFKEVALIEYPRPGLWTMCFVVATTKGEIAQKLRSLDDDTLASVFVPTVPNPTSGFLIFVPREELRILDMSVEDGAKVIFSAGLVTPAFAEGAAADTNDASPEQPGRLLARQFAKVRRVVGGVRHRADPPGGA